MTNKTKKVANYALISALAYLSVVLIRIPVVLFLNYEPKDVIITIGGFIFGPLAALLISVIVSFLEMVTISQTGIIGFLMNVISTGSFAAIAALIYKRDHCQKGALVGLILGSATMTILMLLWNYFLTPIYMNMTVQEVVPLIKSAILPFNLIKVAINTALTLILYKPIVKTLRSLKLVPESRTKCSKASNYLTIFAIALFLVAIVIVLHMQGVL